MKKGLLRIKRFLIYIAYVGVSHGTAHMSSAKAQDLCIKHFFVRFQRLFVLSEVAKNVGEAPFESAVDV